MFSEDIEANTSLKLRAFMQANFIALDSRVDGGTSISWKFLNTSLLLVDCYCQEGFAPLRPP